MFVPILLVDRSQDNDLKTKILLIHFISFLSERKVQAHLDSKPTVDLCIKIYLSNHISCRNYKYISANENIV